jgi:hypothetical protein
MSIYRFRTHFLPQSSEFSSISVLADRDIPNAGSFTTFRLTQQYNQSHYVNQATTSTTNNDSAETNPSDPELQFHNSNNVCKPSIPCHILFYKIFNNPT